MVAILVKEQAIYWGHPTERWGEYLFFGKTYYRLRFFGLKCDESEVFFSSNFHDMKKVVPVEFGEIKMSFWVRTEG